MGGTAAPVTFARRAGGQLYHPGVPVFQARTPAKGGGGGASRHYDPTHTSAHERREELFVYVHM